MAHTPGPWEVGGNSGNQGEAQEIVASGRTIAWTADTYDEDEDEGVVTDEDRANARLIAAAPEMLGFLHQIADECKRRLRKGKDSGDLLTLQLCRAAISKAEGGDA